LKQALVKASALPREEQDEIAALIMARIAGDEFEAPRPPTRFASFGDVLDKLLPKHPAARTLTLTMVSFILLVQAPMALLAGVMMVVQAATAEPSGAMRVSQVSVGGANRSVIRSVEPEREVKIVGQGVGEVK
jgi:hypothetical protein